MNVFTPVHALLLSALLFSAGAYGVMARRNLIVVLLSIELMLNAVNLSLVALASVHGGATGHTGHVFVLLAIGMAAAEAAVGLAFLIATFQRRGTVEVDDLSDLKG
jgi:NADH-quinone oxidoreductase subunit K